MLTITCQTDESFQASLRKSLLEVNGHYEDFLFIINQPCKISNPGLCVPTGEASGDPLWGEYPGHPLYGDYEPSWTPSSTRLTASV
jgi:hypothetical protein